MVRAVLCIEAAGRPAWNLEFLVSERGQAIVLPWSVTVGLSDEAPGAHVAGAGVRREALEGMVDEVTGTLREAVRGTVRRRLDLPGVGPVMLLATQRGKRIELEMLQQVVVMRRHQASVVAELLARSQHGVLCVSLQRRPGNGWWCRSVVVRGGAEGQDEWGWRMRSR